jgi:hypothetical protein
MFSAVQTAQGKGIGSLYTASASQQLKQSSSVSEKAIPINLNGPYSVAA